jgi:hypothetical protein
VPTPLRTRAAAIVTTRIFLNSALPVSGPIWPHRPELPPGSPRQICRATSASVSPNRGEIGGRGATGFSLLADERCRRLPPSAGLAGLLDGPAWIRTRDQRIMSLPLSREPQRPDETFTCSSYVFALASFARI